MSKSCDLVFTNGCFDVIHIGHIRLLEFSASMGRLVVGLNSDASVKKLKGPSRPINSEKDRKELLLSIRFVSDVVIFEEDTPIRLIEELGPDIIVKGGDYRPEDVVGYGISDVIIFPLVNDVSSTKLIRQITRG